MSLIEDRSFTQLRPWEQFDEATGDAEAREAIRVAYRRDIERILHGLSSRRSVLLECDRAVGTQLFKVLREKRQNPVPLDVAYNQGQPGPVDSVIHKLLSLAADQLKEASLAVSQPIVCFRHLDLMAMLPDGRARNELPDLLYWFSEYPGVVKIGLWDPTFSPPEYIRTYFPERVSIQSIDRSVLWELVGRREAEKLTKHEVLSVADQARLYQQLGGVNAPELRRVLRSLVAELLPPKPETPEAVNKAYALLRRQIGFESTLAHREMVGYEGLKDRLERDIIVPLGRRLSAKNEQELRVLDEIIPQGIVLHGAPGNGKSGWALWLAEKIGAQPFLIHGPELKSKYVGETEASIRRVFAAAREAAPSVVLVDEIDALTPARSSESSNFERSMVAQLLTELAGLRQQETVLVVGTTNRLQNVDYGFKRPGRFLLIEVGYPNESDRKAILEHYSKKLELNLDCDSQLLAQGTREKVSGDRMHFLSGDHLRELCRALARRRLEQAAPNHDEPPSEQAVKEALEEVWSGVLATTETPGGPKYPNWGST